MCDEALENQSLGRTMKAIPVSQAVGTVLAHDITEIRPGEFKGRAFKKGHVVKGRGRVSLAEARQGTALCAANRRR